MKIPKLKKWQWVLAGLGALCLGYCGVQQGREVVLNYQASEAREVLEKEESFVRVYYGRISFEVPKNAAHGGEISIRGSRTRPTLTIRSEPWPNHAIQDEAARKAEYDKRWEAFIKNQQAHDDSTDKFTIVRNEELQPGVRVLYYIQTGSPLDLEARAVRVVGDVAAVIQESIVMREEDSQGNPLPDPSIALIRNRLRDVIGRLRPTQQVLQNRGPLDQVMFVDQVALIDQPFDKEEEHVGGFWDHPLLTGSPGSFGANTRYSSKEPVSLTNVALEIANQAASAAMGVRISLLRRGSRTVGGIEGGELIHRMSENSHQLISAQWHESSRKEASQLRLTMGASVTDIPRQLALWDHALDSVRWHGPTARRNAP